MRRTAHNGSSDKCQNKRYQNNPISCDPPKKKRDFRSGRLREGRSTFDATAARLSRKEEGIVNRKRRSWSAEQKLEILREARENAVPVSEVCRRHGVSPAQFYSWEKRARDGALEALQRRSAGGNKETDALLAKVAELRSVIAEVITENLRLKGGRWP
jgi:transposase-like protein